MNPSSQIALVTGVNHANAFFDGIMRAHNFYRHVAEPAEGALKLASQLLLG